MTFNIAAQVPSHRFNSQHLAKTFASSKRKPDLIPKSIKNQNQQDRSRGKFPARFPGSFVPQDAASHSSARHPARKAGPRQTASLRTVITLINVGIRCTSIRSGSSVPVLRRVPLETGDNDLQPDGRERARPSLSLAKFDVGAVLTGAGFGELNREV